MSTPRIVQLELNEVPFRVIDAYVAIAPQSTLAGLLKKSRQLSSICPDKIELDPWISWPTLHRGVIDEQHRILHLGQMLKTADETYPPLWRRLADAGLKVGVFGSIHSNHVPDNVEKYSFYVPDFFDDVVFAHPPHLLPFQRFNLGMTRRSARNVDTKMPADLFLDFARSAPRLGLSPSTLAALAKQILSERKTPRLRIRRRSLQSLIMGDIFIQLLRTHKPDFATLYSNHVAANMHRYWAATFPDDHGHRTLSDEWIEDYKDEIFDAMDVFDKMLAKTLKYCEETGSVLLLATSMGQGPVPHEETRQFVSITKVSQLMSALGFTPDQYRERPAMVPCNGVVMDPALVPELTRKLDQITVDGHRFVNSDNEITPLSYGVHDGGFVSLFSYFESYKGEDKLQIGNETVSFEAAGFGHTAHEDGVSVTAHHTKDGVLIIYDPSTPLTGDAREETSTTEIAPAILEHFGLPKPGYMSEGTGIVASILRSLRKTDVRGAA